MALHPEQANMTAGCQLPNIAMHARALSYLLRSSSVSGAVKSWGSSAALSSGTASNGLSTATDTLVWLHAIHTSAWRPGV